MGLLVTSSIKIVIGLSIFIIFVSMCLIDLFIAFNDFYYTTLSLKILEIKYNKSMRSLSIVMVNNELLDNNDELFKGIYNTLINSDEFNNFGSDKIIILSCILEDNREFNLHSNVLINKDTSFEEYYNSISDDLINYSNLQYGYNNLPIIKFIVKVWDATNFKNVKIKTTHNALTTIERKSFNGVRSYSTVGCTNKNWNIGLITPLSLYNKRGKLILEHPKPIFTMDIETIKVNGFQTPIAISSCGPKGSNFFLIDHLLLINDPDKAVNQLWFNYINGLIDEVNNLGLDKITIFAHNLGDFDGYFLYKGLLNTYNPENVSSIMDHSNSFISITLKHSITIEWKDSLRIFPISLDELCNLFVVTGKLIPYDLRFNDISLFNNHNLLILFKKYSLQDAVALYESLTIAQSIYFSLFKVDIESIYSTATLALKIFRTKFLDKDIFILPEYMDSFIRNGYYGGGTDVYKAYGENVHYYDVNSLYPSAMLNPMPYNLVTPNLLDLSNRSLDSFFGFVKAEIYCPSDMLRPVLPYHSNGKTIYPTGIWTGVYFSEELKAVSKLGYQIRLISGYEFTKADLFSKYVKMFYEIKRTKGGSEKAVAKLLLNNLYGYFGRKQINIITQNVKNEHLEPLLLTRVVKSINQINKDYSTVLSYSNINHKLLNQLNNEIHHVSLKELTSPIKSNVAIAAAVTSYARIHMIPFKIDPNTLYTDTDSIFTLTPIDPKLLGDGLGLMKDEMNGLIIKEALLLGPKQYGYWYLDKEGNMIEKSVFSGVSRDSLTFGEIIKIGINNNYLTLIN